MFLATTCFDPKRILSIFHHFLSDDSCLLPSSFLAIGSKATFTHREISFKMVYNMTMFLDFQILTITPGAQNLIGDFHQFPVAEKSRKKSGLVFSMSRSRIQPSKLIQKSWYFLKCPIYQPFLPFLFTYGS